MLGCLLYYADVALREANQRQEEIPAQEVRDHPEYASWNDLKDQKMPIPELFLNSLDGNLPRGLTEEGTKELGEDVLERYNRLMHAARLFHYYLNGPSGTQLLGKRVVKKFNNYSYWIKNRGVAPPIHPALQDLTAENSKYIRRTIRARNDESLTGYLEDEQLEETAEAKGLHTERD